MAYASTPSRLRCRHRRCSLTLPCISRHLLPPSQYNCGEAVNFATSSWLRFARVSNERYRRFSRASVFSHDRLMLKLAGLQIRGTRHLSFGLEGCRALYTEVERMYREERKHRGNAKIEGVGQSVKMPPQSTTMDSAALTYDERRRCLICEHACFFSAVVCEGNPSAVVCLRHRNHLCGCVPTKKCLILWQTEAEIKKTVAALARKVAELQELKDQSDGGGEAAGGGGAAMAREPTNAA
jgi:hypothetical protein